MAIKIENSNAETRQVEYFERVTVINVTRTDFRVACGTDRRSVLNTRHVIDVSTR